MQQLLDHRFGFIGACLASKNTSIVAYHKIATFLHCFINFYKNNLAVKSLPRDNQRYYTEISLHYQLGYHREDQLRTKFCQYG